MTLRLAGFQVFCARVANTLLTSWSPLTYERGDALQAFEEEHECLPDPSPADPPACGEGPSGACDIPPSPPLGFQLPMFDAKDLESIAAYYLVHHFPWPDEDGKFHCCRTTGLTITEWSQHVSELQVSELVFTLQGLVYDQSQ